ncbi:hypothetical protein SLS58_009185 [Diplodia intermedia]|uniref:Chromo domain-containing protein n=1 Tax=Diplodia intermedia TaxID=856260 RepID=A0ABR3TDL8_9PEZI
MSRRSRETQCRYYVPSHQGVANGQQNGATTSTTASPPNGAGADAEDADGPGTPLAYVPNRAIPPIAPTPPSASPLLPHGRRRGTIVSRRYDPATMQPLYRVRIDPVNALPAPGNGDDDDDDDDRGRVQPPPAAEGTDGQAQRDGMDAVDDPDGCAEEHTAPLADILAWVSPAELERFELEWEDDVVVMIDEEGAVLLVSKEAQRAMMGWGQQPPSAAASGPAAAVAVVPAAADALAGEAEAGAGAAVPPVKLKRGRKKKPTKEFVDMLPARRRRGRPPKVMKMEDVMGVVGGDGENAQDSEEAVETASETAEYGEWVNPAHVRGTAPESVVPDRRDEREEMALSDSSDEDPLGKWRTAGELLETEQSTVRSTTSRRGSSRADAAQRGKARRNGSVPAGEPSMPASPVRRSMSSNGARLRRSSMSSNNSAANSFRTADSRRHSMRSSATPSRSSSGTGAESRAAGLLSTFHSTQKPSSRRKRAEEKHPNGDPEASPRATESITKTKRRRTSTTVPTTSALHQASSMLHPPAEGSSWEPEVEDEEEYEIESIISDQLFGNTWYYLVKWANWPPDEHSWFTEEELDGAREVLDAYLEQVRRKNRKGSKKGKERAVEGQLEWDHDEDVEMALR